MAGAVVAAGFVVAEAVAVAAADVVIAGAGSAAAVAVSGGIGGAGGGVLSPPQAMASEMNGTRAIRMAACIRQMR